MIPSFALLLLLLIVTSVVLLLLVHLVFQPMFYVGCIAIISHPPTVTFLFPPVELEGALVLLSSSPCAPLSEAPLLQDYYSPHHYENSVAPHCLHHVLYLIRVTVSTVPHESLVRVLDMEYQTYQQIAQYCWTRRGW